MTKSELIFLCRQLKCRIEQLEAQAESPPAIPHWEYLGRIAKAFDGLNNTQKNWITRTTVIKALEIRKRETSGS